MGNIGSGGATLSRISGLENGLEAHLAFRFLFTTLIVRCDGEDLAAKTVFNHIYTK